MLKVHHLNCISSCPLGGHLMDHRHESVLTRGHLTNHCLLIESQEGLILVDTGFGLKEVFNPQSRISSFFLTLNSPDFREELTAIRQIERLGFSPKDVRHILLTHLDFDHAGGLDDFPWAKVHLLNEEQEAAFLQKTWLDRQRFRPQQWNTKHNWQAHGRMGGENWHGFEKVVPLANLSHDLALIPLIGHTLGHVGIAVKSSSGWLLHAGDAYFYKDEMHPDKPYCTPGLQLYQRLMDKDHGQRVGNQERLRVLKKDTNIEVFCSHDLREYERLANRAAKTPARK